MDPRRWDGMTDKEAQLMPTWFNVPSWKQLVTRSFLQRMGNHENEEVGILTMFSLLLINPWHW
jgi:hypothetical protein